MAHPIQESLNLGKRKSLILDHWHRTKQIFQHRFNSEVNIALLGLNSNESNNWKEDAFQNLKSKCSFLIDEQGFEPFEI